ncbi:MAG: MFS transporter [Haloferacaceae archaeon]
MVVGYLRRLFSVDRRVLALAIARAADSLGNSFLIVVLPLFIEHLISTTGDPNAVTVGVPGLHATLPQGLAVGVVLSMFGFLNSFGQPFTGRWSDRTGHRRAFVLFGLGVLAVTNVAYAFAGTYLELFLIRAIQGVGVAFTIPATIALVNELATTETRGNNMGVFNTFRLLGFGLGPIIAGGVVRGGPYDLVGIALTGYNAAFVIASLGALVSFTLVVLLVSDPERVNAEAGENLSVAVFDSERDALLDPVFTLGLASLFMAIGIALISAIESQVNAHLHQGAFLFGVEFASFTFAQVIFQAPIGSASDEYGRKPFVLGGLLLLVPATFAQGFVAQPWTMAVARFVQGVAGAAVFAPAMALAGDYARAGESGTQLSVLTMAFGLGVAIGPLVSGALARYSYSLPFVIGAALALLGAILVHTQVEDTVRGGGARDPERTTAGE